MNLKLHKKYRIPNTDTALPIPIPTTEYRMALFHVPNTDTAGTKKNLTTAISNLPVGAPFFEQRCNINSPSLK